MRMLLPINITGLHIDEPAFATMGGGLLQTQGKCSRVPAQISPSMHGL